MILAFILGLVGAIVIYLSFWYGTDKKPVDDIDPTRLRPDSPENKSIPPVLIFLYAAIVVYMVLYIVLFFVFGARSF